MHSYFSLSRHFRFTSISLCRNFIEVIRKKYINKNEKKFLNSIIQELDYVLAKTQTKERRTEEK